jgi:hypothetical protein
MKNGMLAIVVVLALCAFPAAATPTWLGLSAGYAGFFSGGATFAPIDVVIQTGSVDQGLFYRTDGGVAFDLQSSAIYLDAFAGLGFRIFTTLYAMAGVEVWAPVSSGLDFVDDSMLLLKPAIGYEWKGFFAELSLPLTITYADLATHFGWEIRGGYRFLALR